MIANLTFDKCVFINYVFGGLIEPRNNDIHYIFTRTLSNDFPRHMCENILTNLKRRFNTLTKSIYLVMSNQLIDTAFDGLDKRIFDGVEVCIKESKSTGITKTVLAGLVADSTNRLSELEKLKSIKCDDYIADTQIKSILRPILNHDGEDVNYFSTVVHWAKEEEINPCLFITLDKRDFSRRDEIHEAVDNVVLVKWPEEIVHSVKNNLSF